MFKETSQRKRPLYPFLPLFALTSEILLHGHFAAKPTEEGGGGEGGGWGALPISRLHVCLHASFRDPKELS